MVVSSRLERGSSATRTQAQDRWTLRAGQSSRGGWNNLRRAPGGGCFRFLPQGCVHRRHWTRRGRTLEVATWPNAHRSPAGDAPHARVVVAASRPTTKSICDRRPEISHDVGILLMLDGFLRARQAHETPGPIPVDRGWTLATMPPPGQPDHFAGPLRPKSPFSGWRSDVNRRHD
jgi:hypothetical protein